MLFGLTLGCGREPSPTIKAPSAPAPKSEAPAADTGTYLVTLKVEGMV
jgi:hypothetical protein